MRIVTAATVLILLATTGGSVRGDQTNIPESVCRADETVSIRNTDLKTGRFLSSDLYRFTGNRLYISSEGRAEYFYNDVRQVELGRYSSAHKTIVFERGEFKRAVVIHTDSVETRVLRLRCTAN